MPRFAGECNQHTDDSFSDDDWKIGLVELEVVIQTVAKTGDAVA